MANLGPLIKLISKGFLDLERMSKPLLQSFPCLTIVFFTGAIKASSYMYGFLSISCHILLKVINPVFGLKLLLKLTNSIGLPENAFGIVTER